MGFLILYAEDVNGEKETEGIEREIDIWAANQKTSEARDLKIVKVP